VGYANPYLESIQNLNVYRRGERRAPHKPLLLLAAISKLIDGKRDLPFSEVVSILSPLLSAYAPPVKTKQQPELPYWHLQSDGLWEIPGANDLPLQIGRFPRIAALRATSGHLEIGFAQALESDPAFLRAAISVLLEDHFPESLHSDILAAVGIRLPQPESVAEQAISRSKRRQRDSSFRPNVLRAYEHRCAVTGFQVALGGQYFGCEAAHVQWHAYDGPDRVDNGFAVEPTLHKLFDAGAWSLSDDRRVMVSAELTGAESTVTRVRGLHGSQLRSPLPGEPEISIEYIQWHRERDLGGVFRHPALPL
jgi:putative restriction endonuclease